VSEFEITFASPQEFSIATSNALGYFSEEEWDLTRTSVMVTNPAFSSPLVLDRWRLGTISHDGREVKVLEISGSFHGEGDVNIAADVLGEVAQLLGGRSGTTIDPNYTPQATTEQAGTGAFLVVVARLPLEGAMATVPSGGSLPDFIVERVRDLVYEAPQPDVEYRVEISVMAAPDADRGTVLESLRQEISLDWSQFVNHGVKSMTLNGVELE
jgi:hypothetical protein